MQPLAQALKTGFAQSPPARGSARSRLLLPMLLALGAFA
jgi:hypothetical protein